ncbi:hypothetical protein BCD_1602 (plasmid) [Borrelia crocidurae DOU]|uniref:Uncharacterized protein n=1 Tax=Borrelia crocidurae DOU TaxID=1293575 RepID=W5SLV2_9SPIR|nr:hypothetical protein BCD_1602 [Borrelia crocidurae DOU]
MLSFVFHYSFVCCLLVFIGKSRMQVKKAERIKGNREGEE